jgi:hypothetical protein
MDRRYPLVGAQNDRHHHPQRAGTAHVTLSEDEDEWEPLPPVELKEWWAFLCDKQLMVAPLVFRNHAVFRPDVSRTPRLGEHALPGQRASSLSDTGEYLLARSATRRNDALPRGPQPPAALGTHIIVRSQAVARTT